MRLTLPATLLVLATLSACGPDSGSDTGSETGTGASSTGSPGSTSEATTSPGTTGPATTTGEPATTTTGVPGTTGEPVTSTGEPGTTTGTTTDSSSDTSTTTGAPPAEPCVTDQDCGLHNDCCECYGVPAGQDDPVCDLDCDQPQCDQLGVGALCRFGVCTTDKLDCDASKVVCKSLPPECPDGSLPGVNGNCWAGTCVPVGLCNAVPTCDLCPTDTMCVQKISKQKSWPACEPVPAGCDEIDCECAGAAVCTGVFNSCNDLGGNELSCGCPVC